MPKFLIVMCIYMVYLLLFLYCGALVGCPGVSKTKTLNRGSISVVFFSCFKKFKCLGDVLDSVTPITVFHIEVPSFGRFYNLAQILIKHSIYRNGTHSETLRHARWSFINNKLLTSLETKNLKPFWRYIKSQHQDRCGVCPLLHDGQLHSDSRCKAEILNQQFCSVFTDEDTTKYA